MPDQQRSINISIEPKIVEILDSLVRQDLRFPSRSAYIRNLILNEYNKEIAAAHALPTLADVWRREQE